jgi:lipopolysaccharide/colanic/teichoic acid biosynthesis glycosyltransferase
MTHATDTPGSRLGEAARSRRFALALLVYLVLTVVVFWLVQRYTIHIAALYNYDIKNVGLQFALYFAIFAALTLGAFVALQLMPLSLENRLRLAFLAGATLSLAVALYQARFGPDKLVNYLVVGTLGTFATSLVVTRRQFRLVEVIARPPEPVVREVERAHAGVTLVATPWDYGKRAVEAVTSLAVIAVSLPISIPLTMAVWFQDPGPLLVAKVAVMRAGRSFNQLKLRSMVKNAEASTGPVPASPDDGRVTWLGGVLRRTHIDELPQMINIARGEMSFVGPRPERTVFVQRHLENVPDYALRHAVRPGLAGMAQVYGDYYSTPAQKLRYDLLYIRRRSLALDLQLFTSAVLIALFGVYPGGRRQRRHHQQRRYERQRWRAAYTALRGEPAPDEHGRTHAAVRRNSRTAQDEARPQRGRDIQGGPDD